MKFKSVFAAALGLFLSGCQPVVAPAQTVPPQAISTNNTDVATTAAVNSAIIIALVNSTHTCTQ